METMTTSTSTELVVISCKVLRDNIEGDRLEIYDKMRAVFTLVITCFSWFLAHTMLVLHAAWRDRDIPSENQVHKLRAARHKTNAMSFNLLESQLQK